MGRSIPSFRRLWLVVVVLFASFPGKGQVRIACAGDSLSAGYGTPESYNYRYPVQLASFLDGEYEVKTFARGGRTLSAHSAYAFVKSDEFAAMRAWGADCVVLLAGSNDSLFAQEWSSDVQVKDGVGLALDTLRAACTNSLLMVCVPPPLDVRDSERRKRHGRMVEFITEAARERDLIVIDLYNLIPARSDMFDDGIHPSAGAAAIIAEHIGGIITNALPVIVRSRELP